MSRSAELINFYEQVREMHNMSELDPRFNRTALEQYVKHIGHDHWAIEEEQFLDYSAWVREEFSKKKGSGIPS